MMIKPPAAVARTKLAIRNRKLSIPLDLPECLYAQSLFRRQLLDHRLRHIKTMNRKSVAIRRTARKCARHQARNGAEHIPPRARWELRPVDYIARAQWQPGMKRHQRDSRPGNNRPAQKVRQEFDQGDETLIPLLHRHQAQTCPTRSNSRHQPGREIGCGGVRQQQPKPEKYGTSRKCACKGAWRSNVSDFGSWSVHQRLRILPVPIARLVAMGRCLFRDRFRRVLTALDEHDACRANEYHRLL